MSIVFILLGAVPATLFVISKMGLDTPPQEHLTSDVATLRTKAKSREDFAVAA